MDETRWDQYSSVKLDLDDANSKTFSFWRAAVVLTPHERSHRSYPPANPETQGVGKVMQCEAQHQRKAQAKHKDRGNLSSLDCRGIY